MEAIFLEHDHRNHMSIATIPHLEFCISIYTIAQLNLWLVECPGGF
jgi:hypothetical protein